MKDIWFGELRKGWKIKQYRYIFRIHNGATPKSSESDYWGDEITWITPEDLGNNTDKYISDSRRKITEEGYVNCGASIAPAGSIALSTRAPIGHIAITAVPACVNQGCRLLEPKEGDASFLYYALSSAKLLLISRGQGTTFMELPRQNLASMKMAVPPFEEQKAIARFLDFKTAKIDTLIAEQQTLLDKLAEKRTALISHAVTKGLDPSVPTKDSGVAWLGEIPTHWKMTRVRFVIEDLEQGWSPQCNNYPADDDQWGVMKVGCVNGDQFDSTENKSLPDEIDPLVQYEITAGDILVSRANTKELLGSAALVRSIRPRLLLCDKLYRMKASTLVDSDYLVKFLRSSIARYHYERHATGASGSMQNIGQDTLKNLPLPLPPKSEQKTITDYLNNFGHEISSQIEKVERVIERLQEYRTTLITSAVTGKIDVREYSSPRPVDSMAS